MKLIFTRGTFREKLFSSMLFTTLTTLMLCSSLLLIVFRTAHGRRRIRLYP